MTDTARPVHCTGHPMTAIAVRDHGAVDMEPDVDEATGRLTWDADPVRVAIDRIAYSPDSDTFTGWQGPEPMWSDDSHRIRVAAEYAGLDG